MILIAKRMPDGLRCGWSKSEVDRQTHGERLKHIKQLMLNAVTVWHLHICCACCFRLLQQNAAYEERNLALQQQLRVSEEQLNATKGMLKAAEQVFAASNPYFPDFPADHR